MKIDTIVVLVLTAIALASVIWVEVKTRRDNRTEPTPPAPPGAERRP